MNNESYLVLHTGGTGEIIEKKSRFIATLAPVNSEEEALAFIETLKKKYWDARHNCSAYTIGRNHELARCSDDGEPARTAGRPMLDVLMQEGLHNVVAVVTRYFGGVLLGTGGLVRAYQSAVKEGISACTIIRKQFGRQLTISTDYTGIGKLQYIAAQEDISLLSAEYTDVVTVTLFVTPDKEQLLTKKMTEATGGKAVITQGDCGWFAIHDNKLLLFDQ